MSRHRYFFLKRKISRRNSKRKNAATIISLIVLCYISTFFDEEQWEQPSSEYNYVNLTQTIKPKQDLHKDNLQPRMIENADEQQDKYSGDYEFINESKGNYYKWRKKEVLSTVPIFLPSCIDSIDKRPMNHISLNRNGHETKITNRNVLPASLYLSQHAVTTERNSTLSPFKAYEVERINIEYNDQKQWKPGTFYTNRIQMPEDRENFINESIINFLNSLLTTIKKLAMYECVWYNHGARIIEKNQSYSHANGFCTDYSASRPTRLNSAKSPGNATQPSKFIIVICIIMMLSPSHLGPSTSSGRPAVRRAAPISQESINKLKVIHAINSMGQITAFQAYQLMKGFDDSKSIKEYLINDLGWTMVKYKKNFDRTQRETIDTTCQTGKHYDISLLVSCLRILSEIREPDSYSRAKWMNDLELEGKIKKMKDLRNAAFHSMMGISNSELRTGMDELEKLLCDILSSLENRYPDQSKSLNDMKIHIFEQVSDILVHPLTPGNIQTNPTATPESTIKLILDRLRSETANPTSRIYASMSTTIDCDQYNMHHKNRGYAYIFAHDQFSLPGVQSRSCAEYDAMECKRTFEHLGFVVQTIWNKGMQEFKKELRRIAEMDHSQSDALVVIFMSHGGRSDNIEFLTLNDSRVPSEMLTEAFSGDRCESLCGKPKLIFIQACRGSDKDQGVGLIQVMGQPLPRKDVEDKKYEEGSDTDEDRDNGDDYSDGNTDDDDEYDTDDDDDDDDDDEFKIYSIPKDADTLIMWASFQGKKAYRMPTEGDGIKGSVFIHMLCKVLYEDHIKDNLKTMLQTVSRRVATYWESKKGKGHPRYQSKQQPTIRSTLLRTIMFKPKTEPYVEKMEI